MPARAQGDRRDHLAETLSGAGGAADHPQHRRRELSERKQLRAGRRRRVERQRTPTGAERLSRGTIPRAEHNMGGGRPGQAGSTPEVTARADRTVTMPDSGAGPPQTGAATGNVPAEYQPISRKQAGTGADSIASRIRRVGRS